MKIKAALVAISLAAAPITASAQSGNDILGGILGAISGQQSNTTAETVKGVLGHLLGTSAVSEKTLVGTWSYSKPCVAFESKDVLSNLGGSYASTKIESTLTKGLEKAGVKPGKCAVTFNANNSFRFTVGKRTQEGTYAVTGNTLTLTFSRTRRVVTMNIKQVGNSLQIAAKADKMLQLVNAVATKASAYSNKMSLVSTLLGNFSGMYLGMEYAKTK